MIPGDLVPSLHKILSLKHVLFTTFDTAPLGLSLNKTQERVLMIVRRHERASMQFLSREAGLEKGSLTTVIDSLEERSLVKRERPDDDKRAFIVTPTPDGIAVTRQIDSLFRVHLEALLKTFSSRELNEFERSVSSLARLISRLASRDTL